MHDILLRICIPRAVDRDNRLAAVDNRDASADKAGAAVARELDRALGELERARHLKRRMDVKPPRAQLHEGGGRDVRAAANRLDPSGRDRVRDGGEAIGGEVGDERHVGVDNGQRRALGDGLRLPERDAARLVAVARDREAAVEVRLAMQMEIGAACEVVGRPRDGAEVGEPISRAVDCLRHRCLIKGNGTVDDAVRGLVCGKHVRHSVCPERDVPRQPHRPRQRVPRPVEMKHPAILHPQQVGRRAVGGNRLARHELGTVDDDSACRSGVDDAAEIGKAQRARRVSFSDCQRVPAEVKAEVGTAAVNSCRRVRHVHRIAVKLPKAVVEAVVLLRGAAAAADGALPLIARAAQAEGVANLQLFPI